MVTTPFERGSRLCLFLESSIGVINKMIRTTLNPFPPTVASSGSISAMSGTKSPSSSVSALLPVPSPSVSTHSLSSRKASEPSA